VELELESRFTVASVQQMGQATDWRAKDHMILYAEGWLEELGGCTENHCQMRKSWRMVSDIVYG